MKVAAITALAIAAAAPVMSTIVVTLPVASTTSAGGRSLEVEWEDDGKSPTASDWGRVNIYLATGSHDVQYKLQTLDTNVSYTKNSGSYKINSNAGPNGGYYFIRFEGTQTDATGIPEMAFSARFTLSGMSGTFNSTIMSELSGSGGTTSSGGGASATGTTTTGMSRSTSTASASATTTAAKTTPVSSTSSSSTSGASQAKVAGLLSALVGVAAMGVAFL
ncbi:hypothetical protein BCV70DRAFT_212821 [Testicularia cyperi]|uniref:Yeast cell wall synthesis Kre9/Knh1-like N-terminal domain-containing protein n=1 Tax=Testicularia cyperi TaxID=1882483 RepID=A0A317XKS7_9BASI|nr:hypothetical protein BCV70DRAFT_212821 [Testicularia cyperi]